MDKTSYKGYKVGDRVSVKATDSAYDSAGDITPDMVGTIKAFPPKVRKCIGPLYDRGDYFAYIEFDNTYTHTFQGFKPRTYQYRGGIDICNLRKFKPTKEAAHG
jgi:hypothetical protein